MKAKKGNAILVVLFVALILVFLLQFVRLSPTEKVVQDPVTEAQTQADLAYQKSLLLGAQEAMETGLSLHNDTWFCNRPIPPPVGEANESLRNHTNERLESFRDYLKNNSYVMRYDPVNYNLSFPLAGIQEINIPGDTVIVTDLSGSMKWYLGDTTDRKDRVVRETNRILIQSVFNKTPGARVGLVSYSEGAQVDHRLTQNASSLFETLNYGYDAPDTGATCLACGLYRAVEMLVPPPPPASAPDKPLSIILMSDGGANRCFPQGTISGDCQVLNHTCSDLTDRNQSKAQATNYSKEAYDKYNITIYTVVFKTNTTKCTSRGQPAVDCYDPDTMQDIAGHADGDFGEGDNQSALNDIYRDFANESARYMSKSYQYLKLEENRLLQHSDYLVTGVNRSGLLALVNFSKEGNKPYPIRTWYLYKGAVNWMLVKEDLFFTIGDFRDRLTAPCKAVWDGGSCSGAHMIDNASLKTMYVDADELNPRNVMQSWEDSLNSYLDGSNYSNATCSMKLADFNITNKPIFHYSSTLPPNTTVNITYGNGAFRQTGDSSGNRRISCPQDPPLDRNDFLGVSQQHTNGTWGVNNAGAHAPSCDSSKYEHIGVDRRAYLEIEVSCVDRTSEVILDGRYRPTLPRLTFTMKIDMMNDCDPPGIAVSSTDTC